MRGLVALFVMTLAGDALAQPYRPVYGPPPPSPAQDPDPVDPDEPFLFVAAHLGLDLPVGAIGGELGVGIKWLRGSVSAGRGFRGTSVAAMARVVHQEAGIDFALGVGLSRGPALHDLGVSLGESSGDDGILTHYGSKTHWLDTEISAEYAVSESGFVRFTLGLTRAIDTDCVSVHTHDGDAETACDPMQLAKLKGDDFLPYLGLAGGFRFPRHPSSRPRARYIAPQLAGWSPST